MRIALVGAAEAPDGPPAWGVAEGGKVKVTLTFAEPNVTLDKLTLKKRE